MARATDLRVKVDGNPGNGNTFVNVGNGGNYNPNVNTINNMYFNTERRPNAYRITQIINKLDAEAKREIHEEEINLDMYYIDQKVKYNNLERWADDINELTVFSPVLDSIYAEYERFGQNKSANVMRWLNDKYRRLNENHCGDELFDSLLDFVCKTISEDHRLSTEIMGEDLEFDVRIVLVDAFIKCKIFKKPV